MQIFNNTYIEIDGVQYYDISLYSYYDSWGNCTPDSILVNAPVESKLHSLDGFVDKTIRAPKNSVIYLTPNCPYAIDDIRKNYTIKRKPDTGDYNVFSPIGSCDGNLQVVSIAVFPSLNAAVTHHERKSEDDMFALAKNYLKDPNREEMIYKTYEHSYNYYKLFSLSPVYKALLDGELEKPCIGCDQLDINSENELTTDVLELVYKTGLRNVYEQDSEKNFLIQLNVLNQHNWREYPGTISMLFGEIMRNQGIYSRMCDTPSRFSKPVKELLSYEKKSKDFASEKDFLLAQKYLAKMLNIDGSFFTTVGKVYEKCGALNLTQTTFSKLFKNIVKITPNKFEDVQKD